MTRQSMKHSDSGPVPRFLKHIGRETLIEFLHFPECLSEEDREALELHLLVCEQCQIVRDVEQDRLDELRGEWPADRVRHVFELAVKKLDDVEFESMMRHQCAVGSSEGDDVVGVDETDRLITCPPLDLTNLHAELPKKAHCEDLPGVPADLVAEHQWEDCHMAPNEWLEIVLGEEKILQRLQENPFAKSALGSVVDALLRNQPHETVFVESGSTPKLAMTSADRYWANSNPLPRTVKIETNNSKIADWKPRSSEIRVRGIFGGHLNAEFGGFFPVSEEQIDKAMHDGNDHDSQAAVDSAWNEMVQQARNYDRLFMTASRFNFYAGPFVSSKDNALLKLAYHSAGRRFAILLDGSKLLANADVVKEWFDDSSVQVFDHGEPKERGFIKQLLGLSPGEQPDVWEAKRAAARRNPGVQLRTLPEPRFIPKGARGHVHIARVSSWENCVMKTLKATNAGEEAGDVSVYVSEPDAPDERANFERRLHAMVEEANGSFRGNGERVHIAKPEMHAVVVNPRSESILLPPDGKGVPVRIWECRYQLIDGASREGRRHAAVGMPDATAQNWDCGDESVDDVVCSARDWQITGNAPVLQVSGASC
jgi:hypothetical protein